MANVSSIASQTQKQLASAKKAGANNKYAKIQIAMDAESIRQFSAKLGKVDKDLRKRWAAANREIGKDWQQQSLYWMSQLTRTGKSKKLKRQIKRSVTTKGIKMKLDKKPGNFIMGTEYGSHKYGQFEPSTNPVKWPQGIPVGGYGVHEAIRRHISEYRDRYMQNVKDVFEELDMKATNWAKPPVLARGRRGKKVA